MMAALSLAPHPCLLLSMAPLTREASSGWAQGGIAAAVGDDDDVSLQVADTLAAGDGLCDPDTVRAIVGGGPRAIERLAGYGVRFDRDGEGRLALGLEAAHSRPSHRARTRRRHRRRDRARTGRGGPRHSVHHRPGRCRPGAPAGCRRRGVRRGDPHRRPRAAGSYRAGGDRHRRCRRPVPRHHQSARLDRLRPSHRGPAPVRRWAISNSSSSTRPHSPSTPDRKVPRR